jgi:hypothetical protein
VTFIRIYGGGAPFLSLNIVASNILRSFGHSRDPMVVNILTLGVTVIVSLAGLFGPFRFSIPGLFSPGGLTNARLRTHPSGVGAVPARLTISGSRATLCV